MVWSTFTLFNYSDMSEGSKIISASIVGADFVNVIVNNKIYSIFPPTIHKLAGAGLYLSDFGNEESVRDIIKSINDADKLAHALSWFVSGNDNLYKELVQGTFDELVDAISQTYSLVSVENFMKLSTLVKNVATLIANQK